MPHTLPLERKFWPKVAKSDGCWKWTQLSDKHGYGIISHNGSNLFAHRVSWMIHKGEIPKGMSVLHHCDNPNCVNPDHLFLGTQNDNMQDMITKGRHWSPFTAKRKLSDDAIRTIRKSFTKESVKRLASEYGVTEGTIYTVARGQLWRRVA